MSKRTSKNTIKNLCRNVVIMLKILQQMHLKNYFDISVIPKTAEATGDLTGSKIADETAKVS